MRSVRLVVVVTLCFSSGTLAAGDTNETVEIQTIDDIIGTGTTFSRNLSASVSVIEDDLRTNRSEFPSDNVNSTLEPAEKRVSAVEFNTKTTGNKSKLLENFRPSPQLETYVEFNRHPVRPAYPEAKVVPGYGSVSADDSFLHGKSRTINYKQQPPSETPLWSKNEVKEDTPWVSRVRFPTGPPQISPYQFVSPTCCQSTHPPTHYTDDSRTKSKFSAPLVNERGPSSYYGSTGRESGTQSRHGFAPPSGPNEGFDFNKLVEVPKKYYSPYHVHESPPYYEKTHESYNLMEKPTYSIQHGGSGDSWKKLLKLLVTFIPIGLLISALTPSVISISNANDTNTQTRYRSNSNPKKALHDQIFSSLQYFDKLNENGCEYRVFCELLLTANGMPDSQKHVNNLLDNFAAENVDYKSRAEELTKVFEAVRNQDCSAIDCDFINNPT